MCTLIVSFQQHPNAPVLVAANRDELRGRPASAPRRWPGESFVAPKDEQAGGTWLGLTSTGLFVGVTNRFPSDRHPDRESRGTLVADALRAPSAEALRAKLEGLGARRFNTFHLLYADANHAFVSWNDGVEIRHASLTAGLHVVTERSLGGDDQGRTALIESLWPKLDRDQDGTPTSAALQSLLAQRNPDAPAGSVCVDVPELGYGTRSSLVLFVRPRLEQSRWFWAEGPPDRTTFVESPELIRSLTSARGS
jgi:uncharacterized protein with NRDE domain